MVAAAQLLRSAVAAIGLEGFLLVVGTTALAVAASWFHPVGALLVIGSVTLVLGFAVALRGAP